MVSFTKTELDPERLPALQERIRSAQEEALQLISTVWPADAKRVEQNFDVINDDHRIFIRAAIEVPQITAPGALKKHDTSCNRLLQQAVLGGLPLSFGAVLVHSRWPFAPWIVGLVLLAAIYPYLVSTVRFRRTLRAELPWIQVSSPHAQFLADACLRTGVSIVVSVIVSLFTLVVPVAIYANDLMVESALTTTYIVSPVLALLLGTSLWLFVSVFRILKRTKPLSQSSGGQSKLFRLDAMENLLKGLEDYEWESQRRNLRIPERTEQAMLVATARAADELVAEYVLSPVLAQRLKDATWWESRILYTTPEFTPGAPFPTPEELKTAMARVRI